MLADANYSIKEHRQARNVASTPDSSRRKQGIGRVSEDTWQEKVLHGQYIKKKKKEDKADNNKTQQQLKTGKLRKEQRG